MSDWYMVTQLKNFRDGRPRLPSAGPARVADGADGRRSSTDDRAINDVVAYINTFDDASRRTC